MILGFLLIAMVTGLTAGSAALILGHGLWMALLIYSATGVGTALLGVFASVLKPAEHQINGLYPLRRA